MTFTDEFEQAFADFLDDEHYDQGEQALFDFARAAFIAGWKAAGGHPELPAQWQWKKD